MDFPLPDINLRDISKLAGELPDSVDGDEIRNLFDRAIDKISRNRSSSNLVIVKTPRSTPPIGAIEKPTDLSTINYDATKTTGDAAFNDKTTFVPKPLPHSPKISPSSIPNPNPSVTATKQLENSYPNYKNYLFSIPGYSAFQPVSYQGLATPTNHAKPSETANQSTNTDFTHLPVKKPKTMDLSNKTTKTETKKDKNADFIIKTDFEDKFTTEIITSITTTQGVESKLNITSLRQGSGATVTIPSQIELKKKTERFSLKTSIPISKIDMKCVNPNDNTNLNNVPKKPIPFNPAFSSLKTDSRVEIQSNVVIKGASNEMNESKDSNQTKNINTLIDAAEAINKSEQLFWNLESDHDIPNDAKDLTKVNSSAKPLFSPIHHDTKLNFIKKPPDGAKAETANQIVFIQNKANNSPKMLVALTQQQNNLQPQALSQKTADSKNLQAPSRLSNVNENCKEELIKENGSSKVVSLKRLHHENCDEDDFENLITENQIYGNKIVVKERSQGTLQEQDLKPRVKPADGKNMILQPNFLYLSNVQFPANVMMIKNTNTINQNITEQLKNSNRIDNKVINSNFINTNDTKQMYTKTTSNIVVSKDNIHVLKSNNSVLQTLAGKQNKQDVLFQTNQNMIMNPQIIYQVPMLVESDTQKLGQTFLNQSYSKFITQKKDMMKEQQPKPNEKLYIACPYQMDTKMQPKIVITNIRPTIPKTDEISTLDIYEKRRKMRRLRNSNNPVKSDPKKIENRGEYKSIITADNMKDEMSKEFAKTKIVYEPSISDSESDYERDELRDYAAVIRKYSKKKPIKEKLITIETKKTFLSMFKLGTLDELKDKNLEKQERIIQRDAVAKACIAAGRIDRLTPGQTQHHKEKPKRPRPPKIETVQEYEIESSIDLQKKQGFLAKLQLARVTKQYKEDYEKAWQEIKKERRRRNGQKTNDDNTKAKPKPNAINSNDQLKLLSDIKSSVTENNNLIKRRLDTEKDNKDQSCEADNICAIAEKSFNDLSRLSKMADISVQILSGNDTKKQDINPGFDSERTQKTALTKPNQSPLNIPSISKIISLRTELENSHVTTTPATSMDEPSNCAAYTLKYRAYNHIEIVANNPICSPDEKKSPLPRVYPGCSSRLERENPGSAQDEKKSHPPLPRVYPGCSSRSQRENQGSAQDEKKSEPNETGWHEIDAIRTKYRVFDAARKKEIKDLQQRNKQLLTSCSYANRTATREANLYRKLHAERQSLGQREDSARHDLVRLYNIVNKIKMYK